MGHPVVPENKGANKLYCGHVEKIEEPTWIGSHHLYDGTMWASKVIITILLLGQTSRSNTFKFMSSYWC